MPEIKVDIWSDIRCPFCYLGKRKFEMGLSKFAFKDNVVIEWHSFELDPLMKTEPGKSIDEYLAEYKGISVERSEKLHEHMTASAKEIGLDYRFDKVVVANSFDAHRLIQMAKSLGKGDLAEEVLFRAYFTDGKDISSHNVLIELGLELGFESSTLEDMLRTDSFKAEVWNDEASAKNLGINGVPFFVLNNKYAISGAQSPETFNAALEQVWKEMDNAAALKPGF
jgi:predicted DsbA family dithiol-disulfide isomerase